MLVHLDLRDYVIVDRLALEFEPGFGALTGETGAGKSILVDALALALGGRGDASTVRGGRERAEIAAEFETGGQGPAADWLKAQEFDDESGRCLLRRVIDAAGRSRAWINGRAATLAQLRELGELLADIHGQHDHHALLREEAQRELLDAQAGALPLAREVAGRWREWQRIAEARRAAERDAEAIARERDALRWQAEELRQLAFSAQDWAELGSEQRRLSHARALIEGVGEALSLLDESEQPVVAQLVRIDARLAELGEFDSALAPMRELIESAGIPLREAVRALRHYRDRVDLDPQRLAQVEARIEAVHQCARKYRVAPQALPDLEAQIAARLAGLEASADPVALAGRERELEAAYRESAARLSAVRGEIARQLSQAVSEGMQDLAMPGGRFEVALEPLPEPAPSGLERVEFRVAANPDQPPRALARVASGGELSRIGLAIQVIASAGAGTPTLVFDEVDVGIGGRVAEVVGRMLAALGKGRQVLCVTHLPQVAARADWQWSIAKETVSGETLSRVERLDRAGRVEELARMLGGVEITATTRRHAREMLGG
jgi:DNA repair protein RecN (Recombination protein N)